MKTKRQNTQALVEIKGDRLCITSLTISEQFGRPHFRVIKSIKGLVARGKLTTGVVVSSWLDSTGRKMKNVLCFAYGVKPVQRVDTKPLLPSSAMTFGSFTSRAGGVFYFGEAR